MITHAEETSFRELLDKIAYREYVRGLENGWGICEVTINWLRMNATTSKRRQYSFDEIADMLRARLDQEKKRAGVE